MTNLNRYQVKEKNIHPTTYCVYDKVLKSFVLCTEDTQIDNVIDSCYELENFILTANK